MRENGFRAVGGLAQRLASGLVERRGKAGRGGSIARLRLGWSAIVGPDLAGVTRPEALLSGRGRSGTILRLRVASAAALEVQHRTGQIVERVNAYAGHKMIDDVRLMQGVIAKAPSPAAPTPPDAKTVARMAERTAAVEDPDLRAALTRLGARVGGRGAAGRRQVMLGALAGFALAREVEAQSLPREKLLGPLPGDHTLGRPDAPNILIDYASFTCPFCAQFYIAVMPVLRRDWIDPGKLLLIHRHFPFDVVATRASQLAECAGPDKFFAVTERLFRTQVEWLSVGDPLVEMVKILADLGVTPASAQACFTDDRALDKVVGDIQSGQALGVRSTPAIFINDQFYANPGMAEEIAAILRQVGR